MVAGRTTGHFIEGLARGPGRVLLLTNDLDYCAHAQRQVWVGHEISDEHRTFMQLGLMDLIIDQAPDGPVQMTLHHLLHATGYIEQAASPEPNEFRLFCPENVRQDSYLPVFPE